MKCRRSPSRFSVAIHAICSIHGSMLHARPRGCFRCNDSRASDSIFRTVSVVLFRDEVDVGRRIISLNRKRGESPVYLLPILSGAGRYCGQWTVLQGERRANTASAVLVIAHGFLPDSAYPARVSMRQFGDAMSPATRVDKSGSAPGSGDRSPSAPMSCRSKSPTRFRTAAIEARRFFNRPAVIHPRSSGR